MNAIKATADQFIKAAERAGWTFNGRNEDLLMFSRDDAEYGAAGMSAEVLNETTIWGDERVAQYVESSGEGSRHETKTATVREADQLIGRFSVETAPNDFIRRLVAEAVQSGEATATDHDGVEVTAVVREDE